ncbi:MAG: hypothetical protein WD426_05865 [Anditalea sp.]
MLLSKNKLRLIGTAFPFVFTFLVLATEAFAQREIYPEEKPSLKDRMYFGGNFSLQFGSLTFIDVSPLAGVMLTDKLSTGLGATYQYLKFARNSSSVYGGRVFGRYNITRNIFAHTEIESLNTAYVIPGATPDQDRLVRDWVNGVFVGGGYFTPFGNRGGANITLLYNLTYDNRRSPYNEPYVIRVGFVF